MSSKKTDLLVAPCSYEAAKHACLNYHYSRSIPAGKLVKFGVWEDKQFIGCVIFSMGANRNIGNPYNLKKGEVCELTRVALKNHNSTVTTILSKSLKQLKKTNINLKLIVSYADHGQKHYGIIYQASNWVYVGESTNDNYFVIDGEYIHLRSVYAKYGTNSEGVLKSKGINGYYSKKPPKSKYLMPLTKAMRKQILPLSKPYPKAVLV